MNFTELVKSNRTCRRFDASKEVSQETIMEMMEEMRYIPCGANKQVLRFALSYDTDKNKAMYESVKWAGYLREWDGPVEEERPTAYIVLCSDEKEGKAMVEDVGIAAQTIALSARSRGMAACMFKAYDEALVKKALNLGESVLVQMVIALGYPVEKVVVDDIEKGQDIKYYRDGEEVHHVPKLKRDDLIIK